MAENDLKIVLKVTQLSLQPHYWIYYGFGGTYQLNTNS